MTFRRFALLAVAAFAMLALAAPGAAHADHATIDDERGDNGSSFERAPSDVLRVTVDWNGTSLVIAAVYAAPPRSRKFSLFLRPHGDERDRWSCALKYVPAIDIVTRGDHSKAYLSVAPVHGSLAADAVWSADGTSVTYTFSSPVLTERLDDRSVLVCVSGFADDDYFFGSFDGMVLHLTPATALDALRRELTKTYGSRFSNAPRPTLSCPKGQRYPGRGTDPTVQVCYWEFRERPGAFRTGWMTMAASYGEVGPYDRWASPQYTKTLFNCPRIGDLRHSPRIASPRLRASAIVGCDQGGMASRIDRVTRRTFTIVPPHLARLGFSEQKRFQCRMARSAQRWTASCRNGLNDRFVYSATRRG